MLKNELKKQEFAILEQKYQFYLRHCKSKVVRYESTSLLIPGSSLYDDFPERYGYLMVFFTFRKHRTKKKTVSPWKILIVLLTLRKKSSLFP